MKGKHDHKEEEIKFQKYLVQLTHTLDAIIVQIQDDTANFQIFFLNIIQADATELYPIIVACMALYSPFIIKAIEKCFSFQTQDKWFCF